MHRTKHKHPKAQQEEHKDLLEKKMYETQKDSKHLREHRMARETEEPVLVPKLRKRRKNTIIGSHGKTVLALVLVLVGGPIHL